MTLPYESATSGASALTEVQKILQKFGCEGFGNYLDFGKGSLIVQFKYRSRQISIEANFKGYAARWLKEHPYSYRHKGTLIDYEKKALEKGSTAVYSIIRDWVKGQITAIECGILSFDLAFLGQILLSNGETVMQHIEKQEILPQLEHRTES